MDHFEGHFSPDVKNMNIIQYFEGKDSDSFFL